MRTSFSLSLVAAVMALALFANCGSPLAAPVPVSAVTLDTPLLSLTQGGVVAPVSGVSLNTGSLSLVAGGVGNLSASILPANASNQSVSWASSSPGVATVSAGVVSPVAVGSTTVTVTTADGGMSASCAVTVSAASVAVTGVSLSASSLKLVVGSAAVSLTATVAPHNATNQGVSWASDAPAVAKVVAGTVTPLKAGTATITATTADGGKIASCLVTVIYELGQTGPAGGLIFYDKGSYSDGWRYLETSQEDLSIGCMWGTQVYVNALASATGTGKANTAAIVALLGSGTTYAAQVCDALVQGGASDWFLPSESELVKMLQYYIANDSSSPTLFRYYWSSTAIDNAPGPVPPAVP